MKNSYLLSRVLRTTRVPIFFLTLSIVRPALAYPSIAVETSAGYSGNLYSDSSKIGDSFLRSTVSLSSINSIRGFLAAGTQLRVGYDLSYSGYDLSDNINRLEHLVQISLFNRTRGRKLKYEIDAAGAFRDYIDINSDFDSYRIFVLADGSYYLRPGLQLKLLYLGGKSAYDGFNNLNYFQHSAESELVRTFKTRTTARATTRYTYRQFDTDDSKTDWLDLELKLSQSIDIRTGGSISGMRRWTGKGTRPLSSYFIVSGITPYWDPWDGFQLGANIKRILSYGIAAALEAEFWDRNFTYSSVLRSELPWLEGQTGRDESGWTTSLGVSRQFNLLARFARDIRLAALVAYVSNTSSDPFYSYDYLATSLIIRFDMF